MDIALIESYILLFFTASSMGWCMEVLCKLIQFKRFINRGFLIGPWRSEEHTSELQSR